MSVKVVHPIFRAPHPATMTSRITFISHAVTPALRHAAFPRDEALEAREVARLRALAWKAPPAQQILTAPEKRAAMTAESLSLTASIAEDLRDCNYGSWKGRQLSEVEEDDPDGLIVWLSDPAATPHCGESIKSLVARVGRWCKSQAKTGHTIAVTHPAIIRSAVLLALSAPLQSFWRLDIAAASVTDLRYNCFVWTVRSTAARLDEAE